MMTLQQMAFIILMVAFYGAYFIKMMQQRREGVKTMILGEGNKPKNEVRIEKFLKLMTFTLPTVQLLSMWLNIRETTEFHKWIGIVASALGVFFFIAGMVTMKSSWRAGIPEEKETSLVTSGIYRLSRNPAFLGFDLMYIGILIAYPNAWLALFTGVAIFCFHKQIKSEEKFLTKAFGDEYTAYAQKVGRYFGRPRHPRNTKGRVKEVATAFVVLAAIYFIFPLWLRYGKEKMYDKGGIEIYANPETVNKTDVEKVICRAEALLRKYRVSSNRKAVYVFTDSRKEFKLKNLFFSSDALAMNWVVFNYIVFAPVDFNADEQPARQAVLNRRNVSRVIAHELTHSFQADQLGMIGYKLQTLREKWKVEGLAEYVAESSSVPTKLGLGYFLSGKEDVTLMTIRPEYFYFTSHLKVDYLLGYKKMSYSDLWQTKFDESELETEIKQAIRNKQYVPQF